LTDVRLLAVAGVAGVALAACAPVPELDLGSGGSEQLTFSTACDRTLADPCDVRQAPCRGDVLAYVACLREGGPGLAPEFEVITPEAHQARVDASLDEETAAQADDWGRALALLGLASTERSLSDDRAAASVGVPAYYQDDTGTITIVDPGGPLDSPRDVQVLAHELVHALQFGGTELGETWEALAGGPDGRYALSALIEGEAELYEALVTLAQGRGSIWHQSVADWVADRLDRAEQTLRNADSPFAVAYRVFPYAWGLDYVLSAWKWGGAAEVASLFEAPPTSTRELMAGWVRPEARRAVTLPEALGGRLDPPAEAEGWEARDETELGRLFLGLFLQRSEDRGWITLSGDPLRCDSVADVASAWTADRLQAFWGPGQERASLVWRLRFEARGRCDVAATLAERLREGAERRGLDWRVERAEREVRLVAWRDG